jgi:predicted Zn-dependent protease
VTMLRKARDDVDAANAAERPVAVGVGPMINSHLGRLLAEGDDPADLEHAVAYLRDALEADPADSTVGVHLALAMQAQFERRTMRDVEALYRAYLQAGAPEGRAADIRARLEAITRG